MSPIGVEAGFDVPIAFFIFNRPDVSRLVFDRIAAVRPRKLLVVADGARKQRSGEAQKCAQTRAIIDRVDWECEVVRNYSDSNLGCKKRVSSGLSWVFENVEEAIILEDDCIPDQTFFRFCKALLKRFRDDERVSMISGDNFQPRQWSPAYSYYFSRYTHIWGWASWRRAWQAYDVEMKLWPELREGRMLEDILGSRTAARYWTKVFDRVHGNAIDTWDYQWTFASWVQNQLSILPASNLVSNAGFGGDATHTVAQGPLANLPLVPMQFPLSHPPAMIRDYAADDFTQRRLFGNHSILLRTRQRVMRMVRSRAKKLGD